MITPDRRDKRLQDLASATMHSLIKDDGAAAGRYMQALGDEFGGDGVVQASLLWIDRLLYDSRLEHDGKSVQLVFLNADTGTIETADEVPAMTAWVGRLIAARVADDQPTFTALVMCFPDDRTFAAYMAHLVESIAYLYRTAVGMRTDG